MLSQGSRHRAGHIYAVHKGAGSDKVWFMLSRGTGIEQRLQVLSQLSRHSADQKGLSVLSQGSRHRAGQIYADTTEQT